jgi:hypothetical protein
MLPDVRFVTEDPIITQAKEMSNVKKSGFEIVSTIAGDLPIECFKQVFQRYQFVNG